MLKLLLLGVVCTALYVAGLDKILANIRGAGFGLDQKLVLSPLDFTQDKYSGEIILKGVVKNLEPIEATRVRFDCYVSDAPSKSVNAPSNAVAEFKKKLYRAVNGLSGGKGRHLVKDVSLRVPSLGKKEFSYLPVGVGLSSAKEVTCEADPVR